jgi:hypothetical protein
VKIRKSNKNIIFNVDAVVVKELRSFFILKTGVLEFNENIIFNDAWIIVFAT